MVGRHTWKGHYPVTNSETGEQKDTDFTKPYLLHKDGHVITCQHKAWIDMPGVCMWMDTRLGPWVQKQCGHATDLPDILVV
mmetsp:Transcript_39390/g.98652  ORF Transcript_39390/g.98652 Transcript_39390/m.98652 type:complete len:81 (+) Transcript_39390:997-1239(+)